MIPLRPSHVAFYAAVVTVTSAAAMVLGFWFIRQQMLTGNDFLLDAESKEILGRVNNLSAPITPEKMRDALEEHTLIDQELFYFQAHEPAGKLLYQSPNLGTNLLVDLTGGEIKQTIRFHSMGLLRVAEYHTPLVHVQIAMSLRNFEKISTTFTGVFLIGVPLIAVLSVAFGMVLREATLRPVRLIQSAARGINASNLSERIKVPPDSGEMAALARLLNEMIERLERSLNHAKRFTADTSHELMTPLSVIRLHTEKLLNDPELLPKHRAAVEEQLNETLHLSETLERLLMLARADSSVLPMKLQSVSVHDFMAELAEDANLLAESRGLRLVVQLDDHSLGSFDRGWMRQVMFNLLANALRFSPAGGTITIKSRCTAELWEVEVMDEGPGVPPDRLQDIFERFVQISPRAEKGAGAGLGLAICRSILDMHHGEISARLRTDRSGLIVFFALPLQAN